MGYERIPNIVATGTYVPPKPKTQYKIKEGGYYSRTRIVTVIDDYDPTVDSIEDCIDTIIKDDTYHEHNTYDVEEL